VRKAQAWWSGGLVGFTPGGQQIPAGSNTGRQKFPEASTRLAYGPRDYRLEERPVPKPGPAEVITSYTRWVEAVQVRGAENQEVYLTFSPRFERIWLESKKRLCGNTVAVSFLSPPATARSFGDSGKSACHKRKIRADGSFDSAIS
jgi:hypothetical protein